MWLDKSELIRRTEEIDAGDSSTEIRVEAHQLRNQKTPTPTAIVTAIWGILFTKASFAWYQKVSCKAACSWDNLIASAVILRISCFKDLIVGQFCVKKEILSGLLSLNFLDEIIQYKDLQKLIITKYQPPKKQ